MWLQNDISFVCNDSTAGGRVKRVTLTLRRQSTEPCAESTSLIHVVCLHSNKRLSFKSPTTRMKLCLFLKHFPFPCCMSSKCDYSMGLKATTIATKKLKDFALTYKPFSLFFPIKGHKSQHNRPLIMAATNNDLFYQQESLLFTVYFSQNVHSLFWLKNVLTTNKSWQQNVNFNQTNGYKMHWYAQQRIS